ncbi:MAG: DEAD/DEAH box helicase [Bacilli bacterium]|nr:DEAD/DEAH box helicase [Bacilli bacterium]
MFLIKIADNVIETWKRETDKNSVAKKFYSDLHQGNYDVYFSYDPKEQKLLYEAYPKKEGDDYHSLFVGIDREVSSIGRLTPSPVSEAFALYLHETDGKKSEEELKEIYGALYVDLAPLALLSAEDALDRQQMMPLFRELSQELLMNNEPEIYDTSKKLDLDFYVNIGSYDENIYGVRIKAGMDGRMRFAKSALDFVNKSRTGGSVLFYRDYIKIAPYMIQDEDKPVLNLLANEGASAASSRYYYLASSGDVHLTKESLCNFFFYLQGREIHMEDKPMRIDKVFITPKVSILADGSFDFEPRIDGELFFNGLNCAMVNYRLHLISLLRFSSMKEATMYKFMVRYPDFRFDLFQNEISSNLIPVLDDNISVSDEFKEKHPSKKEEIRYYITYTEKDTLTFQSEFINGSELVSETIFVSHPVGESKLKQFKSALEYLSLPMDGEISSQSEILSFLKMDLMPLKRIATILLSENLTNKKVSGVGKINIKMKSGIDWLNMELGSDVYTSDELNLILDAYKKKKKYVRLHDSFISFEDKESKSFLDLVDDFDLSSIQREKLPIYDALKLSSYNEDEVSVIYSKEIKDLFDDIKNFKEEKVTFEPDMEESLRPYQVDGVKWLHVLSRHNLSGILADDMGLGKTLEMIALISLSKSKKPVLIVSPKSLIYNWESEFHKWNPRQRVFVLDGDKTSRSVTISQIENDVKDVYITSYDSLRNDLELFEKYSFSYLVLDEGQNIANVYAKKTRAVKEIQGDHKFVLTGTPIQNSLMDLWSIFDFLMPGYLESYKNFYRDYGKLTIEDQEQKDLLMQKVAPFVLKRTKKEVLKDLPPKEEQVMTVGMSDPQRELYDAYIQRARNALNSPLSNKIAILAEITRLREICVDPSMFIENYEDISEKLQVTIQTIKNAIAGGHKLLVFSTFARTLFHLEELLKAEDIASYMIYGDTKAKDRLMLANDFNTKEDVKVMLVSLKAGGTGLNLIGADIVIHLDPWWNLAAENQASDRAHRIGQKRSVTVLKMVCKNSIEERVIELQEKKKELTSVINEGDESITSIDTEDLRFLLE